MPNGNFTFFSTGGGGGAAASDYLKDAFDDLSVPASNNTGFSSTVGKNPFNQAFANDDAPKFEYKTLYIKDLVLLTDRTKWISDKPTYQVIFQDQMPGVYAYVFGNVRLRNTSNGMSVDIRSASDGFGITTTGRRIHWFLNPDITASQSAYVKVDGATNAVTVNYGSYAGGNNGFNKYYPVVHATTQDTRDIHDYQLIASNNSTLNVAGIGVFFENTAGVIDCYPGSTYVDKDKKTTTTGAGATITGFTGYMGGNVTVYKTGANAYAVSAVERTSIFSVGVGTAGTNTIAVETGKGASFPVGTGIVVNSHGGSYYVGSVQSVSTDTLTVGPSLYQGLSGLIYKAWQAGPTYAISATLYQKVAELDCGGAFNFGDANWFNQNTGIQFYQHPQNVFRAYGTSFIVTAQDGWRGVAPVVGGARLIAEGRFVAAEAEWSAAVGVTAMLHTTVMINGAPGAWSQLQGFTGNIKQTIFTDSLPGWNTMEIGFGATTYNAVLRKINFYDLAPSFGVTLGRLASVNVHGSSLVNRPSIGITNCALGSYQRLYSDQLYLTGAWARSVTMSAAGAVLFVGGSSNASVTANFYGKDFAVLGTGNSVVIQLNGANFGSTLNQMLSVATLGFHSVVASSTSGSFNIHAFEFFRPRSELNNLQTFMAAPELDDAHNTWVQAETPLNPKQGDVWADDLKSGRVWMYLWNKWVQLQTVGISDDPQIGSVYYYGGN